MLLYKNVNKSGKQISHAATSAGLSDRQKFPFFFRTVAVESAHNAAILAVLRHFRWDSVSVLVQNEDDYSLVSFLVLFFQKKKKKKWQKIFFLPGDQRSERPAGRRQHFRVQQSDFRTRRTDGYAGNSSSW